MHRINVGGPTHHAAYLTKFLDNDIFETLLISGNLSNGETSGEYILNNYSKIKNKKFVENNLRNNYFLWPPFFYINFSRICHDNLFI